MTVCEHFDAYLQLGAKLMINVKDAVGLMPQRGCLLKQIRTIHALAMHSKENLIERDLQELLKPFQVSVSLKIF